jgi:hypothetical protein
LTIGNHAFGKLESLSVTALSYGPSYKFFGKERYTIESETELPDGKVEVTMDYVQKPRKKDNPSVGGSVTLSVDG